MNSALHQQPKKQKREELEKGNEPEDRGMNSPMNANGPYWDTPELGDLWTFVSHVYKSTTGRIVYRDGGLIRLQPLNGSLVAVNFELDPATGHFLDRLGVTEMILHRKRKDPHFVVQLGVLPGEELQFYSVEGYPVEADETHIVAEVIATEDRDAVVFTDGTHLDFDFIGPSGDVAIIQVHTPQDVENVEAENAEGLTTGEPAEVLVPFPGLDAIGLPKALVEEIPTAERIYSDSIQRTDMFTSLFLDVDIKRQKDPRVMSQLYRISDLLLAMKNSMVLRDENGGIQTDTYRSYAAATLQESLEKQPTGAPIGSLVPVAAIKKVVYTDDKDPIPADRTDVEVRSDVISLGKASRTTKEYTTSTSAGGNPFISYLDSLLGTLDAYVPAAASTERIAVDQDVLRSQMPPEDVEGFPKDSVPSAVTKRGGEADPLESSFLGTIQDRSVRLLGPSRIRNHKTGAVYVVAQADSAATIGHVVLDKNLSKYRTPTRSGVLLWDIQASQQSRSVAQTFYSALIDSLDMQLLVKPEDTPIPITTLLENRLNPMLSLINPDSSSVLDSFGLRNLEYTESIFSFLKTAAIAGQMRWTSAYQALKQAALDSINKGSVIPVPGIVNDESPLMEESTFADNDLAPLIKTIKDKETLLATYDLAYANDLLKYAEATAGPYWYALATGDADWSAYARRIFKSEEARELRNMSVKRGKQAAFVAEPEINSCKHVHELEKVRSIRDDGKRMLMFQKFLRDYQGGQKNNYLLCGTCGENLVCKHEFLLLNEFLNPGRSVALHKALLLEYGNGVFEGSYICKNCGQKISDLEYSTSLEYDDEGRPLVGRSVVEEPADENDMAVTIQQEADEDIPFKSTEDKSLYKIVRTLFERIGLNANEEMYKRVVPSLRAYLKTLPSEQIWNEERRKELAAVDAGKKGIVPRVPYVNYFANQQIGAFAALVLLELQTTDLPIPVAMSDVELSKDGFPIDGYDPKTAGTGALKYLTYGVAGLALDLEPWNKTTWSPISNRAKRLMEAQNALLAPLFAILAIEREGRAKPLPISNVTDVYKQRLAAYKEKKDMLLTGTSAAALSSSGDRLPPIYRPLPRMGVLPPLSETAIGNANTFVHNAQTRDVVDVASVVMTRVYQLGQQTLSQYHAAVQDAGIGAASMLRSDNWTAFTPLREIAAKGLGVASLRLDAAKLEELKMVENASRIVKERDPAASFAGTHLYVPWSAPLQQAVLPTPSPDDYWRLFMKNCFEGNNYGVPHEFGSDFMCRHCKFQLPELLVFSPNTLVSTSLSAKAREAEIDRLTSEQVAVAREALAAVVTINEDSFRALEDAIKLRKQISATSPATDLPLASVLTELGTTIAVVSPPSVSTAEADWPLFSAALQTIGAESLVEEERVRELGAFATKYDALLRSVNDRMTELAAKGVKQYVKQALEALSSLTAKADGGLGARTILHTLVVDAEQVADKFTNVDPPVSKWFPAISLTHKRDLMKLWETTAGVAYRGIVELEKLDEEGVVAIDALRRWTQWMSFWLQTWITNVRPSKDASATELTMALRWAVLVGIHSLLADGSPLLATAEGPEARLKVVKFLNNLLIDSLMTAGEAMKTYDLTTEQIQEMLNVRAEKEKAYFIQKFEKEDADLRKIELIKKKLKIGDWAIGNTKNLFNYNADFYDITRDQLAAMGVPDFDSTLTGLGGAATETGAARYGLSAGAASEATDVERDNLHYAATGEEE